jgi:uncharacterized membrane protein YtjA (UPF0391 family)
MLRWALGFFIVALVAAVLGFRNCGGSCGDREDFIFCLSSSVLVQPCGPFVEPELRKGERRWIY